MSNKTSKKAVKKTATAAGATCDGRARRPATAAGVLNGASQELLAMLPRYGVTGVETRHIFGRRGRLYIRLEEIVEPVQLTIEN